MENVEILLKDHLQNHKWGRLMYVLGKLAETVRKT